MPARCGCFCLSASEYRSSSVRMWAGAGLAAVALTACSAGSTGSTVQPSYASPSNAPPSVVVESTLTDGLAAPWDIVKAGQSTLVSERDSGRILEVDATGQSRVVTAIAGVDHQGESGLLGLAVAPTGRDLYAYLTTDTDNRIVRMGWDGTQLTQPQVVFDGIARNTYHDGGGLTFGPDGMLYVATGDAGTPELAQDMSSPNGKILRLAPDGAVPADNPFPGSPIFSLGHRNVQGLAFDSGGRLWASEFGASDVDELNVIVAGGNYGWPMYEGAAGVAGYIDPAAQWSPTSTASPSGLAILDDVAYVASLRGEVLWQVPLVDGSAAEPIALDLGDLGRLRAVVTDGDHLLLGTSNTDGRGDPRPGDDRILVLRVQ